MSSVDFRLEIIERAVMRLLRSRLVGLEACTITRVHDRDAHTTTFSFSCDPSKSIIIRDIFDQWYITATGLPIGGGVAYYILTEAGEPLLTEAGEHLILESA